MRRLVLALTLTVLTVVQAQAAFACPGCKEATSQQGNDLARGFSYSILFMMPIPFLIVGSFGGYAYYVTRQRQRAQATRDHEDAR
jgi:hypothetical protein